MDIGRGRRARSYIGQPAGPKARQRSTPALKRESIVATTGTGSLTGGQERAPGPERPLQKAARPRSLGAHDTATKTEASLDRRSFPRPWRLSIGSRIVS